MTSESSQRRALVHWCGLAVVGWYLYDSYQSTSLAFNMKRKANALLLRKINRLSSRIKYKRLEQNQLVDYRQKYIHSQSELTIYKDKYNKSYTQRIFYKAKYEAAHQNMLMYKKFYESERADKQKYYQMYLKARSEKENYKQAYTNAKSTFKKENAKLEKTISQLRGNQNTIHTEGGYSSPSSSSTYRSGGGYSGMSSSGAMGQLQRISSMGSWGGF